MITTSFAAVATIFATVITTIITVTTTRASLIAGRTIGTALRFRCCCIRIGCFDRRSDCHAFVQRQLNCGRGTNITRGALGTLATVCAFATWAALAALTTISAGLTRLTSFSWLAWQSYGCCRVRCAIDGRVRFNDGTLRRSGIALLAITKTCFRAFATTIAAIATIAFGRVTLPIAVLALAAIIAVATVAAVTSVIAVRAT